MYWYSIQSLNQLIPHSPYSWKNHRTKFIDWEIVVWFPHVASRRCKPQRESCRFSTSSPQSVSRTNMNWFYTHYKHIVTSCIYIYYMHRERETIVMYQNAVKYNCSYRSLRSLPKALLLSHGTTPKSSSHNLPIRTWVRDPHHRICQIVDDCIIVITHDGSMVLVYIYIYANIKGVYWWDPCYQIYSIHGSYG